MVSMKMLAERVQFSDVAQMSVLSTRPLCHHTTRSACDNS